jgi:hypothetical protein
MVCSKISFIKKKDTFEGQRGLQVERVIQTGVLFSITMNYSIHSQIFVALIFSPILITRLIQKKVQVLCILTII